ncbi:MAG: choice-of-anchor D domain-containing protein [Solirubrobacteraceae bacterium]|nr:choice-of-anchor D domain-containing protein [Solirubrobacteraceae bacterium]
MIDSARTRTSGHIATVAVLTATLLALLAASPLVAAARAAAQASVTPGSLAFSAQVGTASAAQTVTMTNTGDAPLTISAVALGGANADQFAISDGCTAVTLPVEGTCAVAVSFAPSGVGARGAILTFTTDDPVNPIQSVALGGTGTPPPSPPPPPPPPAPPAPSATRGSLSFTAPAGTTSAPQPLTLTNGGNQPMTIFGVAVIGEHFAISASTCGATLAPGAGCVVSTTFSPDAVGSGFAATLRFATNDPVNPLVDILLLGSGTTPRPADRDGDGVPDAADRCPSTPGDLLNGCPSELNADVRGRWRINNLFTQLVSLTVRAPTGSRIVLECSGKRGVCGFKKRYVRTTSTRVTSLTRSFRGRRIFPAGTTITVRVTRPLQTGTYERLVTRSGRRLPSVLNRCLTSRGTVRPCD